MRYMLMCCFDENRWQAMPEKDKDRVMQAYGDWIQELEKEGRHIASEQLGSSSAARTVRQREGRPLVTDGPFTETKEQFGGYHLVECADLDQAVDIASRIPALGVGGTGEVPEVATTS